MATKAPFQNLGPLTVQAYAKLTGRRPSSIRRSIQRGTLKATKIGRDWFIVPSDEFIWEWAATAKF